MGGAIYNSTFGNLKVVECDISYNSSNRGGGIDNMGTAELQDSNLQYNQATYGGGAIETHGSLNIYGRTVFNQNQALGGNGGGIDEEGGSLIMQNGKFTYNSASSKGGAVYCNT